MVLGRWEGRGAVGAVTDTFSASATPYSPLVIPAAADEPRTDPSKCLPLLPTFVLRAFWGSPKTSLSLPRTAWE